MNAVDKDPQGSNNTWRVIAATTAAGLALAVGGCGPDESKAASIRPYAVEVCAPPASDASPDQARVLARLCLGRREGTVAVVGFGLSESWLNTLTGEARSVLSYGSASAINPTLTPIKASAAAMQRFNDQTPDDCVEPERMANRIAAETMKELSEYAVIVALTPEPSCDPKVGGLAYRNGSDVYGASEGASLTWLVTTMSHEVGHNYGLGHSDAVTYKGADTDPYWYSKFEVSGVDYGFNLDAYIEACEFEGYEGGTTDLMAGGFDYQRPDSNKPIHPQYVPRFNPVHIDMLRWPEAVLKNGDDPRLRPLGNDWLTFTPQDRIAGAYASFELGKPVSIKSIEDGKEVWHAYNRIAVVPGAVIPDLPENFNEHWPMELLLVNDDSNSTATVQGVSISSFPGEAHFDIDGHRIDVLQGNTDFRIRAIKL